MKKLAPGRPSAKPQPKPKERKVLKRRKAASFASFVTKIHEDELTPRMWGILDAIDHIDEFELTNFLSVFAGYLKQPIPSSK